MNPSAGASRAADPGGVLLTRLRELIESGSYRPGERLPPERQLAREFGVSRTVLRRALAVLEAEGEIWRGVGQGTFVGSPQIDGPERINSIRNLTSPAEVMEARLAIEPALSRLAALRASSSDLDEITRCCEKAASAQTQQTYELWDGRFHRAIAAAAHNRLFLALFEAMNAVRDHTSWGRAREARRSAERQRRTTEQHREIIEALTQRDGVGAEAKMRRHLEEVQTHLLGGETISYEGSAG